MATVAARADAVAAAPRAGVFGALLRRGLRDGRTRTLGFAVLFAAVACLQPLAYRHAYPTAADRASFAASFAHNKAVVLFYGEPHDLLTVGGYTAWRVGGMLAIFAAVFGVLAAVRALRAEEEAGRAELVLAAAVGRGTAFSAAIGAVAIEIVALWLATFAGLVAGGLPAGGSAFLALAIACSAAVFAGLGAVSSQLAPTRRAALELGVAVVALCFVLRVIADTGSGTGWVRWATPLGWVEQLRPFIGAQPLVLLAPVGFCAVAVAVAWRSAAVRDVGSAPFAARDRGRPRLALLSSAAAQALRSERLALAAWVVGIGSLALVIGIVSKSVTSLGISERLQRALHDLGAGSVLTPKAYIGFAFGFFVLAVSLFAVSQIAAARHEEIDGRLQTLLALALARRRWLGGRVVLAAAGAVLLSLCAGVLAWLGAVSQGVALSLPAMLEASANCLPMAILFLGVGALAYGGLPRAGVGLAYGLLLAAYLWQLFGALLGVPRWLVDATPFAHVGAVPAAAFQPGPAAVMVAVGLLASLAAVGLFERRDLTGV
ncbi:MAG TPA: hypothetical protein VFW09_16270 [Solirubrobacteraceae bacterium]|nr:hypothetical protein [Solirubrobacteraceae bacterium]